MRSSHDRPDHPLRMVTQDERTLAKHVLAANFGGEDIVQAAATSPPARWLPAWLRWPLRVVVYPFMMMDLWSQRLAMKLFRPPQTREGECKRRGNCCTCILLAAHPSLVGKIFIWWNTQVNGFYKKSPKPLKVNERNVWVTGCRYLQKDGSCGNYRWRPQICREWPLIERFGEPRALKGCGFRVKKRAVEKKGG